MPSLKEVEKNLKTISIIKEIVNTFQEIANLKIKQIKEGVLKNREFVKELLETYQRIKTVYFASLQKGWIKKEYFRKTEKEKITIFLSANRALYGTLILEIWEKVEDFLRKERSDLIVVGKIGKSLVQNIKVPANIFYFELDEKDPQKEKILKIVDFAKNYEKIFVFHGRYERGLVQRVIVTKIPGELPPPKKIEEIEGYLFEPSPEIILEFFERKVIGVLFHITVLEHQLALYSARVLAMHQATERAKNLEKKFKILENKLKREKFNKRQIELLGSLKGII